MVFRELMLVSHQKSIEQLQETLRQKLLSDDSWREKVRLCGSSACVWLAFETLYPSARRLFQIGVFALANSFDSIWKCPTPNMLKIYVLSKILDNVVRSKKGKWKNTFCNPIILGYFLVLMQNTF